MTGTLYPTTLSERKIRLLVILPCGKDPQLPLACELQEWLIDSAPEYEALSYCWGDSSKQKNIVCNGLTPSVTINLHDALSRLRLEEKPRIIWADALCINQSNNEEKSFQVSSMGRIYATAKRVVVWLGHADKTDAAPIEKLIEDLREDFRGSDDILNDDESFERMARLGSPLSRLKFMPWEAFGTFFGSPWFTRMWVIQEIRLASDAIFYCGNSQFHWKDIRELVIWMAVDRGAGRDPPVKNWRNALMMAVRIDSDCKCRLLDALSSFRGSYTTDARDNVYGILGLPELDEEKHLIKVDYSKPVAEIYNEVGIIIMQKTQDLEICRFVNHPSDYNGEPDFMSWVPRWNSRNSWHAMLIERVYSPPHLQFDRSLVLSDRFCKEKRELSLNGLFFSAVSRVDEILDFLLGANSTSSNHEGSPSGSSFHPILHYWYNHVSRDSPFLVNDQSAILCLAHTLTAGEVTNLQNLHWLASEEQCTAYLLSFLAYVDSLYHEKLVQIDLDNTIATEPNDTGTLFRTIANRIRPSRVLFECTNGSYGLGPSCLREGDLIVQLEGAFTPHALRPRNGCYLLLGQIYVDSIMNGELVRLMEDGTIQKQEYRLI